MVKIPIISRKAFGAIFIYPPNGTSYIGVCYGAFSYWVTVNLNIYFWGMLCSDWKILTSFLNSICAPLKGIVLRYGGVIQSLVDTGVIQTVIVQNSSSISSLNKCTISSLSNCVTGRTNYVNIELIMTVLEWFWILSRYKNACTKFKNKVLHYRHN